MNLITQQQAADFLGVTSRTIRNRISDGTFTGYMVPGSRAVRVDKDEITSKLKAIPTATARQTFVHGVQKVPFNGNVKLVAEVVRKCQRCGIDSLVPLCTDCAEVVAEGDQ